MQTIDGNHAIEWWRRRGDGPMTISARPGRFLMLPNIGFLRRRQGARCIESVSRPVNHGSRPELQKQLNMRLRRVPQLHPGSVLSRARPRDRSKILGKLYQLGSLTSSRYNIRRGMKLRRKRGCSLTQALTPAERGCYPSPKQPRTQKNQPPPLTTLHPQNHNNNPHTQPRPNQTPHPIPPTTRRHNRRSRRSRNRSPPRADHPRRRPSTALQTTRHRHRHRHPRIPRHLTRTPTTTTRSVRPVITDSTRRNARRGSRPRPRTNTTTTTTTFAFRARQ